MTPESSAETRHVSLTIRLLPTRHHFVAEVQARLACFGKSVEMDGFEQLGKSGLLGKVFLSATFVQPAGLALPAELFLPVKLAMPAETAMTREVELPASFDILI